MRALPLLPLLGAIALAACATASEEVDGPFFPQGVTDGCQTAEARSSSFSTEVVRDAQLFETESSYRAGWRTGYAQCGDRSDITNRPEDLGEQDRGF